MIGVVDVLLANLEQAYERKGWQGTTLRGSLRGVTSQQALWRPARPRHNIWELTLHCAYWKYAVRRRLTGEKRGSFAMKGSNWFVSPAGADEKEWRDVQRLLDEQHEQLRSAIESLPKSAFSDRKRVRLMYGIAAHDLYHTGQIQLLKRLQRS
ncbi:MAG TPA: DinB family protein [Thermoanaerobaculia bacterium]|jgi:uncharacterized damage-inducible protein DinB|nr:DinB family protein [Thermoanaerobaculia bacterium]